MRKLPLSKQNFEAIRKDNFIYVDKTRQIYNLLQTGNQYFLSRPRRFGKSLTVSTLTHLFRGQKDLFKGLYIHEQTDYQWEAFPILKFNFAALGYKVTNLSISLIGAINDLAAVANIPLNKKEVGTRFAELISKTSKKMDKPVVILVDEYDKPIIDFLTDVEQAQINLKVLKNFFSVLKAADEKNQIRFLFITGVSKFSQVSIFSDLNHLIDLTIDPLSHDLVGITEKELHHYFTPHIVQAAKTLEVNTDFLLEKIKLWYDGYTYDGKTHLYNPVSLFTFFRKQWFDNFWFETGTPTFLIKQIRAQGIDPKVLKEQEVEHTFFSKLVLSETLDLTNLMFQTGYLSIKKINRDPDTLERSFVLGYPNIEVSQSLTHNLLEAFTYKVNSTISAALYEMKQALKKGNVGSFVQQIKILLADISYEMLPSQNRRGKQSAQKNFDMWEGYFHTIIYLITSFLKLNVQSEIMKHKGRLDLVVQTKKFLYIMEFKLANSSKNAIKQIKQRDYALSYKNSKKTIYLVGINFDKKERNVKDWQTEIWT